MSTTPEVTVAAVITDQRNSGTWVLLTRRTGEPFRDRWCLPGGHIDPGELQIEAICREVEEETKLDFKPRFFGSFDENIPELNHHHLVQVYEGRAQGKPQLTAEVKEVKWFPIEEACLLPLAFRHNEILDAYSKRIVPADRREELLAEFEALRAEVLKRIELRSQSVNLAITATGIFIAALAGGFIPPVTLLLYPPLALFITIAWVHSDIRIAQIAEYIRESIEQQLTGISWEHWLRQYYAKVPHPIYRRFTELSALGVFIGTQAMTMALAILGQVLKVSTKLELPGQAVLPVYIIFVLVDLGAIAATYWLVRRRRGTYRA